LRNGNKKGENLNLVQVPDLTLKKIIMEDELTYPNSHYYGNFAGLNFE